MKNRSFTVFVYREEDMYVAECPEVGTVDQGKTIEEAIAGLREATRLYLEEFPLPETSPRYMIRKQVATPEDGVMARLAKNPVSVKSLPRLTREDIYEESIG